MKKIILLLLLTATVFNSFAQRMSKAHMDEQNKKYIVTVGNNKLSAGSGSGKDGFTIKDKDIRIVGFLHRQDRIEFDSVYIVTKRGGIVIDSQVLSGNKVHTRWRDFYLNLSDVVHSDHYSVAAYSNEDRKLLDIKYFYIKKN